MPWAFEKEAEAPFYIHGDALAIKRDIRLTDPGARVLAASGCAPQLTLNRCGAGRAAYMSGFVYSPEAARMLLELIVYMTGANAVYAGRSDDPRVGVAWFPASRTLVTMNDADAPVETRVRWPGGEIGLSLAAGELRFVEVS